MIRVFISSSNQERVAAAREFVGTLAPATEARLVGASRDAVDDLVRSLAAPGRATFGLYCFSLTQLAARLATPAFARQGLAHSTSLGAVAVAARVASEALERKTLRYFEPVARCPGFAAALTSTVQALRLSDVKPSEAGKLPDPGADLAALLDGYEVRLREASLGDRALLFRAAQAALTGERPMPLLLLDVPLPTPAERDFALALAASSPRVCVTVPEGDEAALTEWSSIKGTVIDRAPVGADDTSLARLRAHLFAGYLATDVGPSDGVRFFSAPGEGRECVEIARRCLEEARAGIPFDGMAVLLRDPAAYSGLLEAAFARAGVPAYCARGTRRPDPAGRAFLAILACAREKLSAGRFEEYLSLAQVPALDAGGAPPAGEECWVPPRDEGLGRAAEAAPPGSEGQAPTAATDASPDERQVEGSLRAPWRWEEFLVEAAVIGGHDRWPRRLSGLEAEWRLKLQELEREERGSSRALAMQRNLKNLDHLRRFALPVIEALASLPERAKWGEWLSSLSRLAPRVLRRPERVLAVLAELQPMATVGPVGVPEVYEVLASKLSTLESDPPATPYGRVFVGVPELARGRAFAVVFVPGLAERLFPQRAREDPLLLDALREQLAEEGARGLEQQDDRLKRERLLLRLAVGAATKRIHFSYPRLELSKARQRVPSFYALDVQQAVTGRIPDYARFEREAEAESGATLAWPAPTVAAQAIDEMEHDLATLRPLIGGEAEPSAGRARYLLDLNSHLARSLRARRARARKPWSAADGLCDPGQEASEALKRQRLRARPYSVSALQRFAVCPYQFLLYGIHSLEPREDTVALVQLDPLTRGAIFHRVMADFMRELQERGALPITPAGLAAAQELLDEALDAVEREYHDNLAPAIPQVWQEGIETIRTDLGGWLQRAAENPGEWLPVHFEFGFGVSRDKDRDRESKPAPVTLPGGYQLRGVVDVVERHEGSSEWRVTDYKTGGNYTHDGMLVSGGEVLQPVLYGLAVEAALGGHASEGRLYYSTAAGGFSDRVVRLQEPARKRGELVLETIDRAVGQGFLPPAPKHDACKRCEYQDVCGPFEERRAAIKDQERLEDLQRVRSMP